MFPANKGQPLSILIRTPKKVLLEFFYMLEYPLKSNEYREKIERHGLQDRIEKNSMVWKLKGMEGTGGDPGFKFIKNFFPSGVLDY